MFPDLYVACNGSEVDFRFVTEGKMGRWRDAYRFFQSLQKRKCDDDFLSLLDASKELKFGRRTQEAHNGEEEEQPFWDPGIYTERKLFDRIVTEIRKRPRVAKAEDEPTTQRKVWHL